MAKILVVDDEKLIVKGIRFSLEQDGMEVEKQWIFCGQPVDDFQDNLPPFFTCG